MEGRIPCDGRLHCGITSLACDFRNHTARLDVPTGECCDMTGCVSLFQEIDPNVRIIRVYSGVELDIEYRLGKIGWTAHNLRL